MPNKTSVYDDEIQDQLDRLASERMDRLCHIACTLKKYNEHQLYLTMQKDGMLAAIDMEIARVLSINKLQLKLVDCDSEED